MPESPSRGRTLSGWRQPQALYCPDLAEIWCVRGLEETEPSEDDGEREALWYETSVRNLHAFTWPSRGGISTASSRPQPPEAGTQARMMTSVAGPFLRKDGCREL